MTTEKRYTKIKEDERERLIELLTDELPVLRAKVGLSQSELGEIIGISRQTYSAIETKKSKMSWNVFILLVLFYEHNKKTRHLLISMGAFPDELEQMLSVDNRKV